MKRDHAILVVAFSIVTAFAIVLIENQIFFISVVFSFFFLMIFVYRNLRVKNLVKHWPLFLWTIYFISGLVFRQRELIDLQSNVLDMWTIFRVSLVGLVGSLIFVYVLTKRVNIFQYIKTKILLLLILFLIIGFVSVIWSVFPMWSLYKIMEYSVGVLLLLLILHHYQSLKSLDTLFNWHILLLSSLMLSAWLGVLIDSESAIREGVGILVYQIQGVFPVIAANGLGEISAIVSIYLVAAIFFGNRKSWLNYLLLGISLITLVLSQSRSPIMGFLFSMLLFLVLERKKLYFLWFSSLGIVLVLINPFVYEFVFQFMQRGQGSDMIYNLSGRVDYWIYAIELLLDRPFTGYGIYAGGQFAVLTEFTDNLSSVHNTWIQLLVDTSVWGFLTFLMLVIFIWKILLGNYNKLTNHSRIIVLQAIGVFGILTIRSFFTQSFIWHSMSMSFFLILIITVKLLNEKSFVDSQ